MSIPCLLTLIMPPRVAFRLSIILRLPVVFRQAIIFSESSQTVLSRGYQVEGYFNDSMILPAGGYQISVAYASGERRGVTYAKKRFQTT